MECKDEERERAERREVKESRGYATPRTGASSWGGRLVGVDVMDSGEDMPHTQVPRLGDDAAWVEWLNADGEVYGENAPSALALLSRPGGAGNPWEWGAACDKSRRQGGRGSEKGGITPSSVKFPSDALRLWLKTNLWEGAERRSGRQSNRESRRESRSESRSKSRSKSRSGKRQKVEKDRLGAVWTPRVIFPFLNCRTEERQVTRCLSCARWRKMNTNEN